MPQAVKSAGCLIIGDEVLNGKILDTNSYEFAKFCFHELAVPLKKTVVCGDDKADIIRSLQILRDENCDFIVTSGGIGSTHDDITYDALAAAFLVPCKLDQETVDRMQRLRLSYLSLLSPPQLSAFYRMATFPLSSGSVSVLKTFPDSELWVPVVAINDQVYVLPGVPELFKKLMTSLAPVIKPRVVLKEYRRYFVSTSSNESNMAPFLSSLQNRCDEKYGVQQVKVGSYPHFTWRSVTISIIGDSAVPEPDLRAIVDEVVANLGGNAQEITAEREDYITTHEPEKL
ncbi:CIC11C00000004683 [Sungouiella intermedia]|uniref:CIC11C00000003248 n=1 Tax=Sungouiella intermedia TaxID=45354 RepID=A0A1L0DSA2_9ASCO|nr:CIC11C00000003248 [[Candida] intermedia]SGZ55246.1 CIC11C00000004683 [[Candida] intermedia]